MNLMTNDEAPWSPQPGTWNTEPEFLCSCRGCRFQDSHTDDAVEPLTEDGQA